MTQCGVPAVPSAPPAARRGRRPATADRLLALVKARPGGMTVAEMAAETGMTPGAVQQFFFRYQKRGLLAKREASWSATEPAEPAEMVLVLGGPDPGLYADRVRVR